MSASPASRRLFVVDFDVLHYSGHYFNQVFGYGAAARSLGMGSDIYLRAAAPPYVVEHLGASGLLPDVPWHNPDRTVFIDEVPRVQRGMRRLWEGLEGSQISERDIVTVTSSRAQLIYASRALALASPACRKTGGVLPLFWTGYFQFAVRAMNLATAAGPISLRRAPLTACPAGSEFILPPTVSKWFI